MKAGIMQPYFFPYVGYFQLINYVDEWVFLDESQYTRKSWISRNRILSQRGEPVFINAPVRKCSLETKISEASLCWSESDISRFKGKLSYYKYLGAPYYRSVMELIEDIVSPGELGLVQFNARSIEKVMDYLGFEFLYRLSSDLDFDRSKVLMPDDYALSISKALASDQYINPYGGYSIFDESKYRSNGIKISFLKPKLSAYTQRTQGAFVPGLSIIDMMMFLSKNEVVDLISGDFDIMSAGELSAQEFNRVK